MATKNSINSNIPIEVALGGTAAVTLTQDGVLLGNGTSAISATAAGTDGMVLIAATGSAPEFASLTAGANITLTPGANTLTIAANAASVVFNYVLIDNGDSPYTVLSTDYFISADTTLGVITVLLPNTTTTGRVIVIKDHAGTAFTNNITVTTPGGVVEIDGATTYSVNNDAQAISVIFNGTGYQIF